MVKFLFVSHLLFKPQYKFLTALKTFEKKNPLDCKIGRFYQKELFPQFSFHSYQHRLNQLYLRSNSEVPVTLWPSSLDVKKSFYTLMKTTQSSRNKVDSDGSKLQILLLYKSPTEQKKRFLKSFLNCHLRSLFFKSKKKLYLLKKKTRRRKRTKKVKKFKEKLEIEAFFDTLAKFEPSSLVKFDSSLVNPKKKEIIQTLKRAAFVQKVLRTRIFVFSFDFKKLYKKNYEFLRKNKNELLKMWSMFWLGENSVFSSEPKKYLYLKKLLRVRRQKRKRQWKVRSHLLNYRNRLKFLSSFYPPKQFEINYKTLSFAYLGDNTLLASDIKTPFDLEIRKLLTYLSS